MTTAHDFHANTLAGKDKDLADYKGQVLLIVNVASECGLTPQYAGLEKLQQEYGSKGFKVLGFPSNEFGAQEPGSSEQIQQFCQKNYGVTFDMFEKVSVKGDTAHPLYKWLNSSTGREPTWNFGKFLVGKDGAILGSFSSKKEPEAPEIKQAIEKALG